MALKKNFTDEEKIGLTQEEIKAGLKYLRKHKTSGALSEVEALKVYEMYLIGCSFSEIHKQFPQYELGQVILTGALRKWGLDRDRMQHTLRDRVQAKVVKSVIEQVDFLTAMLSVVNAQHLQDMYRFIQDPENNTAPSLKVNSIKEYKEVVETLYKLVQGATPDSKTKTSPMFNALSPSGMNKQIEKKEKPKELNLDDLLEEEETNG